jgi:hypothetical protein
MANEVKKDANKVNHLVESLESVGQVVLGEIEKIGGILTADGNAQAEGDFNVSTGILHHEANKNLQKSEEEN